MNRRRFVAVAFAAAIPTGVALMFGGVAIGERFDRDMVLSILAYLPWAWAMVGVWAETHGVTSADVHWLHPALSAQAIVDHLSGGAR